MIIQALTKKSNGTYEIEVGEKKYQVDEETVLKYRLFPKSEISETILKECLEHDEYEKIKKKAYAYHLKYLKNSYEVKKYLLDREVDALTANQIIEELTNSKQLNEYTLCKMVASSLARNSNGPYLIKQKLRNRRFDENYISLSIEELSVEELEEGKDKLMKSAMKKYAKLNDFEKRQKIKQVFYRHGYIEG